ncbi:hypothetical protein CYY_002516 [Polysphondylium violaceum]|uniref:U3 snoRNP protein n=1 Tax=Polysphondylium violaceum TaxID=133409 RepID=A0A8J4PXY4_9MYCE|nr:hypothetical protein CYY_002516 [Polysphondylium violaceum]
MSKELNKFKRTKALNDVQQGKRVNNNSNAGRDNNNNQRNNKRFNRKKREEEDEDHPYNKYMANDEEDDDDVQLDGYKLPRRFDDEEIEEEEAFDDDDEELLLSSKPSKNNKSKGKKQPTYKTDFEDEEGDDFIDLDELLDDVSDKSSVSSSSSSTTKKTKKQVAAPTPVVAPVKQQPVKQQQPVVSKPVASKQQPLVKQQPAVVSKKSKPIVESESEEEEEQEEEEYNSDEFNSSDDDDTSGEEMDSEEEESLMALIKDLENDSGENMDDQDDEEEEEEDQDDAEPLFEEQDFDDGLEEQEEDEEDEEDQEDEDEDELDLGEDEDDEDEDQEQDSDEESEGSEARQALLSIINNQLKKKDIKNQKLPDMTETFGNESLFNVPSSSNAEGDDGLINLDDLLSFMPEGFDMVKSEIDEFKDKEAISTPMSKFHSEKIQRKITLEQAQKILSQWAPYIKEQRDKPQVFQKDIRLSNTTSSVASNFASTNLNDQINATIAESGAYKAKDQDVKDVDPVEERRRLKEIIKLRSMMYYQEVKDKRKKKIKSKKYHKILKKQKEKDLLKKEQELMAIDPEYAKHKQAMAEENRIRERMTLRHKNQSKFMKNVMKGGLNKELRQSINEQKDLSQDLMNRINNFQDEEESDDDDDSDNDAAQSNKFKKSSADDSDQEDLENVNEKELNDKERIQLKLKKLGRPTDLPDKGINAMKFMQKSLEKDLDKAIKNRESFDDYDQGELDEAERIAQESNRIILHKQVASNKSGSTKLMASGTLVDKVGFSSGHKVKVDSITIGGDDKVVEKKKAAPKTQKQEQQQQNVDDDDDPDNPWLEVGKSKKKNSKKEKKKATNEFMLSLNNLNSKSTKSTATGSKVESTTKSTAPATTTTATTTQESNKKRKQQDQESSNKKSKVNGMSLITSDKQKDLLLQAFANDNIEDEFMQEKQQLLEEEVPEEKSNFLPGWGSWAGEGVEERKVNHEAIARRRQKKLQQVAQKRVDHSNSRVIINEQAPVEGVAKYVLSRLPQHYANKEQYESTISLALGKDWNSRTAFQKLIQPKVSVKPGTYINPVSSKDKEQFILKKKQENSKNQKKTLK